MAYLNLDVGLGDLAHAAVTASHLLRLSELGAHGVDAEVLKGEALDGVDAEDGVGVHDGEATGHCTQLAPVSLLSFSIP